jgi:hypothetical protein
MVHRSGNIPQGVRQGAVQIKDYTLKPHAPIIQWRPHKTNGSPENKNEWRISGS